MVCVMSVDRCFVFCAVISNCMCVSEPFSCILFGSMRSVSDTVVVG